MKWVNTLMIHRRLIRLFTQKTSTESKEISYEQADAFVKKTFIKHRLIGLVGFLIGLKLSGLIFFDAKQYDVIREDLEQDYWKEFGEPKHFEPDIIPCVSPNRVGQNCKSWIQIKYGKDKYLRKVDPAEFVDN